MDVESTEEEADADDFVEPEKKETSNKLPVMKAKYVFTCNG